MVKNQKGESFPEHWFSGMFRDNEAILVGDLQMKVKQKRASNVLAKAAASTTPHPLRVRSFHDQFA
jgi:hypothetical protein